MRVVSTQHLVRRSPRPLQKKMCACTVGPQYVAIKQAGSTRFSWSAGRHRTAPRGGTAPSEVRRTGEEHADRSGQRHRGSRARSRAAGRGGGAQPVFRVQGDPQERRGGRLRSGQDQRRHDQGVPRGERRAGRGVGAHPRAGRGTDRRGGGRADAPPAAGRHLPHRRHPGPGGARADALGRARRRPRLRALPRGARQGSGPGEKREERRGIHIVEGGQRRPLDRGRLARLVESACEGLPDASAQAILESTLRDLYDGVPMEEVRKSPVLAARALIEKEPAYGYVTARLLLHTIRLEVLGEEASQAEMGWRYASYFPQCVQRGVEAELLDPELKKFDLERLGRALDARRDLQFNYLGLQTLYDRYFLHVGGRRIELPQAFFMRVAMGLALGEKDREARAIEFYDVLSSFDFMSSTPTLFNAGTLRSQLSSCYLTTVPDDLDGIYESIKENALLSKFAGGLGNDWTRVRALGSHIKGTNGESQGVVPFLKVVNDTAVAVNQGGKRKGAVCAYLESWHLDVEEFLELRKNTGDDRRRTHDLNTANWIPDLFMRRVMEKGTWTLFSPSNVPDLHDKFGIEFEKAYVAYEEKAARGEIKPSRTVQASDLWRKMLTMLFETGHPWITFKDACNVRSPQQHAGVVHSSNLCTEITLNTTDTEPALSNLGSE